MKVYASHGINEFMIAVGYKGEMIKEYFLNFYAINKDISVDLSNGKTTIHDGKQHEDWKVHLIDTGLHTQTGGRLKRMSRWFEEDETFLFTYGDGVADLNVESAIKFHHAHGKLATVTSVRPPARFGRMAFDGDQVIDFNEKIQSGEGWINGGFFVLNRKAIDFIESDQTSWEREPLQRLAQAGELMVYRHEGFWSCMDTIREKQYLEELWTSGNAPWRLWRDHP
jgi:glucose-1-phosphate cytidylyltransferase